MWAFCSVYFLSKKDTVEHIPSPILRSSMKMKHEHQDTFDEAFSYTIYKIYFHISII